MHDAESMDLEKRSEGLSDAEDLNLENRSVSNETDEYVFVCNSICLVCADGQQAVYIRRSKSWLAVGVSVLAGVAFTTLVVNPFTVGGAILTTAAVAGFKAANAGIAMVKM